MTKVDFYVLASGAPELTACKLAEKAYGLGHRVYIHAASAEHGRQLDELLWTFRDGSFIPHECYRPGVPGESPILIGHQEAPETDAEVLINLAPGVPLFFSRFLRVAEIIGHDTQAKTHGRERYKFYRDRGYALDTHNLGG
jgi:DNA polymerase-3 subunit chi